jgi:hypothetical protein
VQPHELAWIAVLPCALVIVPAIYFLGPPLGRAFLAPGAETLWPYEAIFVFGAPDPVKHARYLIALIGPVLLAVVLVAGIRWAVAARPGAIRAAVAASQALTLGFVALMMLAQYGVVLGAAGGPWRIFSTAGIASAVVVPSMLLATMRVAALRDRVARRAADTRARRIAALVLAIAYASAWLLATIDTDSSIAFGRTRALIPWWMDEPFAILNGRTTLVDFHAMYAQLWPYPLAAGMHVLGATIVVYTVMLSAAGVLTLLAVYVVLRRVAGSSLPAIALFVPVAAAGFMVVHDPSGEVLSNVRLFSMWPMRVCGPYVLAWLTVRHLDGAAPRRTWPLFLVAGLVMVDNIEFGSAALAALIAALVCARPPASPGAVPRRVGEAALGLVGAALLVACLTLVRAGELPRFGLLLEYPHIFGVLGLAGLPMPTFGFQLVLYVTFVAAIAAAIVRALRRDPRPALTGMLAWSGVFGLLAASYYVAGSGTIKLAALFSPWALCLAFLVIVVLRGLAARRWQRPGRSSLSCSSRSASRSDSSPRCRRRGPRLHASRTPAARLSGSSRRRRASSPRACGEASESRSSCRSGTASPTTCGS